MSESSALKILNSTREELALLKVNKLVEARQLEELRGSRRGIVLSARGELNGEIRKKFNLHSSDVEKLTQEECSILARRVLELDKKRYDRYLLVKNTFHHLVKLGSCFVIHRYDGPSGASVLMSLFLVCTLVLAIIRPSFWPLLIFQVFLFGGSKIIHIVSLRLGEELKHMKSYHEAKELLTRLDGNDVDVLATIYSEESK